MNGWVAWGLFWLVVAIAYGVSCWWWPLARCLKCEGKGKFQRKDGKVWRDCRRCKGNGKRLRVGRKVYNFWHARHRATR